MEVPTAQQIVGPRLLPNTSLSKIEEQVVQCQRCARLVAYREGVANTKKREYVDWTYWGRPVPGFGDPNAWLLIVGLAPAAHGGNRTGRVFTGDRSGDFLYKSLYKAGLSNQATSENIDDGLNLNGVYVTAAVKCAPPDNKPEAKETFACSSYLVQEIAGLNHLRAILCLGHFALDAVVLALRSNYDMGGVKAKFSHGGVLELGQSIPAIFCSFHPSPRNTQTGKLTDQMFQAVLKKIQRQMKL